MMLRAFGALVFIGRKCSSRVPLTGERLHIKRGDFAEVSSNDVRYFRELLGDSGILSDHADVLPHAVDWLGNFRGQPSLVLLPETTEQVAAIMKHCYHRRLALVPQSGNTGLVGGSVPVFDEIVLSLKRLNKVLHFEEASGVLTCEAGCILQNLDEYVNDFGHMMPLDLGAKGSCMIGGNIATGAGGIRLLRYGSLHAHLLGLEAVLPDMNGTVLNCMSALRKDNTGFHMPHLFVGSEGTLGVITKIVLTCPARPKSVHVAFLACRNFTACVNVLKTAKQRLAEVLSSFELMDVECLNVCRENLGLRNVLDESNVPLYILLEVAGSNDDHDRQKLEAFLQECLDSEFVSSGTLAADQKQQNEMWALREQVAEAMNKEGPALTFDISLPIDCYIDLADIVRKRLGSKVKRVIAFGHMGDGNLHLMMSYMHENRNDVLKSLYPFVFEWTAQRGGSISAEHGIGLSLKPYMKLYKNKAVVDQMKLLKKTVDPRGILNPYKLVE